MIVYHGVLALLSEHGWSSYRLVKEHVMGNDTIQRIREGRAITTDTLNLICRLCDCQPGDIISYVPDEVGEG